MHKEPYKYGQMWTYKCTEEGGLKEVEDECKTRLVKADGCKTDGMRVYWNRRAWCKTAVHFGVACVLVLGLFTCAPDVSEAQVKPYHFGFQKSRNGTPASIDQEGFKPLLEQYGALFRGQDKHKHLYLTFDNGYENGYTAPILDVLAERGVPAIFFVTGHYIQDQPELLKRMVREGHLIGNHSWSHPDLSNLSAAAIKQELERVRQAVQDVTGQREMRYLRAPRGIFDEQLLRVSHGMGYRNVFWSIAYKDWETDRQRGKQYALDQVMRQLHPGAILLLHSVSRDNAEALGDIIEAARQQGYEFRSLDELTEGRSHHLQTHAIH